MVVGPKLHDMKATFPDRQMKMKQAPCKKPEQDLWIQTHQDQTASPSELRVSPTSRNPDICALLLTHWAVTIFSCPVHGTHS